MTIKLRFLMIGAMGVGKTTWLEGIKRIFGLEVDTNKIVVGISNPESNSTKAQTKKLEVTKLFISGYELEFIDTVGVGMDGVGVGPIVKFLETSSINAILLFITTTSVRSDNHVKTTMTELNDLLVGSALDKIITIETYRLSNPSINAKNFINHLGLNPKLIFPSETGYLGVDSNFDEIKSIGSNRAQLTKMLETTKGYKVLETLVCRRRRIIKTLLINLETSYQSTKREDQDTQREAEAIKQILGFYLAHRRRVNEEIKTTSGERLICPGGSCINGWQLSTRKEVVDTSFNTHILGVKVRHERRETHTKCTKCNRRDPNYTDHKRVFYQDPSLMAIRKEQPRAIIKLAIKLTTINNKLRELTNITNVIVRTTAKLESWRIITDVLRN